ncbi:MAG TPA: replication-associated recombination protein A [Planctomycetota bacterium]|nr:replication-associated recombination protein A [Planctomycetota bacterium]
MSLFEKPGKDGKPLAERMRPRTLAEFVGQGHLLGADRPLRRAIEAGQAGSLILFGPPGVGKTTLAHLIARHSGLHFTALSAVLSGVKDLRDAVAEADARRRASGQGTLLFVDEIHRFNKAQQDALLPFVESGQVVLVGATTENPAFSVIAPLLSRCRVLRLEGLADDAIGALVERALADAERGLGARRLQLTTAARARLIAGAGGDARRALNVLDAAQAMVPDGATLEESAIAEALQHRTLLHDRAGDLHYDLLSALHKSLRNSDAQAALYWLARLIEADADPMQAARRMVAMAAEDIGLADPMALQVAVAAMTALQNLGLPEGRLPLAEAAIYLAAAPKSNSTYRAIEAALAAVRGAPQHPVPPRLRNAPTPLAKAWGHGEGYRYAHEHEGGVAPMECLPDALAGTRFYEPATRGFEAKVAQRLAEADALRRGQRDG